MRKIKIYSTVGTGGFIDTDVTTLGELKPLLRQREIDYDGMKLLVGDTRNELSMDEAILPEGDFKLYLMPQKTKSGGDREDLFEEIADTFADLGILFTRLSRLNSQDSERSYSPSQSLTSSKPVSFEDMEAMSDLKRLQGF